MTRPGIDDLGTRSLGYPVQREGRAKILFSHSIEVMYPMIMGVDELTPIHSSNADTLVLRGTWHCRSMQEAA